MLNAYPDLDPGPVADPDPGSGAFLTPGSGMDKKSEFGSGIWIRDVQPKSYFRELRNHDEKNSDPG
jgi:hypothetical protein